MSVEEVHVPPATNKVDPKSLKGKEEESDYWPNQAKAARGRREYLEEIKMADRITESPEPPPEPPFKVTGEFNLGKVDLQEQQREAKEAEAQARKEANEKIGKLEQERDEAKEEARKTEMQMITSQLNTKIELLSESVKAGMSQKSFTDQYKEIVEMAGSLGLQRPSNGVTDSNLKLEMLRLEHEMKREDRKERRELRNDDRQWQLDLRRLDDERDARRAQAAADQQRNEMFAKAPEAIGRAAGRAIVEANKGGGSPPTHTTKKPGFVAGKGETGEVVCPNCSETMAIGPTATKTVCPNCSEEYAVKRE